MAKQIIGKNGHICIEMSMTEAIDICEFGIPNDRVAVCDTCNTELTYNQEEPVYYIAVLNMLFCKDCFDDYIENSPYYEEDKDFEINNYNHYANLLNLNLIK